jgi:hypothetical protein
MAATALHIAPDECFDDWIVRDDSGRELITRPEKPPNWGPRLSRESSRARSLSTSLMEERTA